MNEYQINLTATITLGGVFNAPSMAAAIEIATMELRTHGEVSNVNTEAIYIDPNPDAV